MTWICTIDGKVGAPSTVPLPGIWMSEHQLLVPGRTGELVLDDGTRCTCDAMPGVAELDAVFAMGAAIPENPSWLDLLDCDPLAPVSTTDLDEHPLEEAIRTNLAALRDVFRRPRTHLELRRARVATGQVRRLDPDAANWLASHSEDWAHLTLGGVHPRHLLAEIRDVRWDLYENRVAVRLVDHLLAWLQTRIGLLGAWLRRFEDLERVQKSAGIDGSWRRKERVFRLWKDAELEENRKRQAQQRLRRLLALRRALDGLRDMPLYCAIPPRASVPDVLRTSNVLQHDANYRKVAVLWRAWARHGRSKALNEERFLSRQLEVVHAWRRFTILLVHRALDQLGHAPVAVDTAVIDGVCIEVDGCALDLRNPGYILVQPSEGPPLRLVPVLADLVHARTRDRVIEALAVRGAPTTVVLHLASASEIPDEAAQLIHLAHEEQRGRIGLIPISPWDIASTERVARALRWALLGPRIKAWPPVVKGHPCLPSAPWLRQAANGQRLLRRPRVDEFDFSRIGDAIRELEDRLAAVESDRGEVKLRASQSKDDHRARNDLNEQSKRLNEQRQKISAELDDLRSCYESIQCALTTVDALTQCPVCLADRRRETASLTARGQGTFICVCATCSAEWGSLSCACGEQIPFLRTVPPEQLAKAVAPAMGADWLDRTLGQDVLAVPHHEAPGRLACSVCGEAAG